MAPAGWCEVLRRSRRVGRGWRRFRQRVSSRRRTPPHGLRIASASAFADDITTRHRFRDGERVFRIVSLRDRDGRKRFLTIEAEEIIS